MGDANETMEALVGNLFVPVWAVRPGAYRALWPVVDCIPLWLAIYSRNHDCWRPCYASQAQLGASVGGGRKRVAKHLKWLRNADLLFEVDRDKKPGTSEQRPKARWALDPFTVDRWRPKVEAMLATIAEEDGQNGCWYRNAVFSLEAFDRRSELVRLRLTEDMPFAPKQPRRNRPKGHGSKRTRRG